MSVKVVVIGAGRMGVAIGGELARRGAEETLSSRLILAFTDVIQVAFFDRTDFNRVRAMAALHAYLEVCPCSSTLLSHSLTASSLIAPNSS